MCHRCARVEMRMEQVSHSHIFLSVLQCTMHLLFHSCISILKRSVSVLFSLKPSGSNCCKPPLDTTEEDTEDKQEATASLDTAKEISVDAAVAAVLPELDGIFTCEETKKSTDFCLWTKFVALPPTGFEKSLVNFRSTTIVARQYEVSSCCLATSTGSKKSDWSSVNVIDRRFFQIPFKKKKAAPFPNVLYGLLPRWLGEINPMDLPSWYSNSQFLQAIIFYFLYFIFAGLLKNL